MFPIITLRIFPLSTPPHTPLPTSSLHVTLPLIKIRSKHPPTKITKSFNTSPLLLPLPCKKKATFFTPFNMYSAIQLFQWPETWVIFGWSWVVFYIYWCGVVSFFCFLVPPGKEISSGFHSHMASDNTTSGVTSPKVKSGESISVVVSPKGEGGGGGGGRCLCSPTTHQGSFRCRFHRSQSSAWMRRSKSLPASKDVAPTHT